jgi:uncharacterized C2H2 Zn-finger protein
MKFNYDVIIETLPVLPESQNLKGILVHGTAIKEVISRNGIKYVAKELEKATPSLKGRPILKDHKNDVDHIVGKVLDSTYHAEEKAIKFKGLITDERIQQLIQHGLINHVSIGASVKTMHEEDNNGEKSMVAEGIEILELSVTPVPGVPSASISAGETFAVAIQEAFKKSQEEEEDNPETPLIDEHKVTEVLHCPDCNKEFNDKKSMADHALKAHGQKTEKCIVEVKPMDEELKIARDGLAEAIIAFDASWTKEDLAQCDIPALKAVLNRVKNKPRAEEKAEPKGIVMNAEVKKESETLVIPAGAEESLRNVKAGTMIIERTGGNKYSFWRMPDYAKQRKY